MTSNASTATATVVRDTFTRTHEEKENQHIWKKVDLKEEKNNIDERRIWHKEEEEPIKKKEGPIVIEEKPK